MHMTTSGAVTLNRPTGPFLVLAKIDWNMRGRYPVIQRAQIWDAKTGERVELSEAELGVVASQVPVFTQQ